MQEGKQDSAAEEENPANDAADPYTQDQLNAGWLAFSETLKIEKPHLYSLMNSRTPVAEADQAILVQIDNKILEEEFREIRGALLMHLRATLNNYRIQLRTEVMENHTELKPYTDKEKFEQMAARNPALNTLREQLDLDIEY